MKNSVATDCYCGSDIDRRGHGCWVRVQYGIEVGTRYNVNANAMLTCSRSVGDGVVLTSCF